MNQKRHYRKWAALSLAGAIAVSGLPAAGLGGVLTAEAQNSPLRAANTSAEYTSDPTADGSRFLYRLTPANDAGAYGAVITGYIPKSGASVAEKSTAKIPASVNDADYENNAD